MGKTDQWNTLKSDYYSRRGSLRMARDKSAAAVVADIKASYKPRWTAVFKEGREHLAQFDKSERSAFRQFTNATSTFFKARKEGLEPMEAIVAAGAQGFCRAREQAT